jgi:hypothetical protein
VSYYLLDHRNPHGDHFYTSRRGSILAIVVHITAGLEDLDGVDDHSAENTARYAATTDRQVSWHSGSDADSSLDLLPASYTAFHVHGYNSPTYGHEISKRETDWRDDPPGWVAKTLGRAAAHLAPKAAELGIPIRKAKKAELDAAIAVNGAPVGFIGHWELDPSRRSDPGRVGNLDTFPWDPFLAALRGPGTQEDDMWTPDQQREIDEIRKQATEANNRASNFERWLPRIAAALNIPFEELDKH